MIFSLFLSSAFPAKKKTAAVHPAKRKELQDLSWIARENSVQSYNFLALLVTSLPCSFRSQAAIRRFLDKKKHRRQSLLNSSIGPNTCSP